MLYAHKKLDYTVPSGHEGGPGIGKQWTPYVGTPFINMSAANFASIRQAIGLNLGSTWTLGGGAEALGGNSFMCVRASAALAIGQLVAAALPTTGTLTIPGVPVSTTAAITTNVNNAAAGTNGEVDNYIFVNATGATLPQLRRIKANTNAATGNFSVALRDFMVPNTPFDRDVFDTLGANGDALAVIRPYHVIVCTQLLTPIGVALGTVTSGNFTIIQTSGLANVLVDADGLNEGIVEDEPAWTAALGAIRGGNAVDNLLTGASMILPKFASVVDVAVGLMVPCFVNFRAQ